MPPPGRAPGTRESSGTGTVWPQADRLSGRCHGLYSYPNALFWDRESTRSQCCPVMDLAN
jgi:hypothetical protein